MSAPHMFVARDNVHEPVPPATPVVVTTLHPNGPSTLAESLREIRHKLAQSLAHIVETGTTDPVTTEHVTTMAVLANALAEHTAAQYTDHKIATRDALITSLVEAHPDHADTIRGTTGGTN